MEKGLIFTYLLTYGGAVVALFNPFVGVLIYVSFSIIRPEVMWSWSVGEGNYSRIVGIALLVGWALRGFGNWHLRRSWLTVAAFICYWLWGAVGAAFAENQRVALTFVEE